MIITKTPYRISFFGGGSDYEEWFEINIIWRSDINNYR